MTERQANPRSPSRPLGIRFATKCPKNPQRIGNVAGGLKLRREDVPDDPFSVDQISRSTREESESPWDSVPFPHLPVRVADEEEGQVEPICKAPV